MHNCFCGPRCGGRREEAPLCNITTPGGRGGGSLLVHFPFREVCYLLLPRMSSSVYLGRGAGVSTVVSQPDVENEYAAFLVVTRKKTKPL